MTNSKMDNGINKPTGTMVPTIVPTKAMAKDKANVLSTDGITSVDVCGYKVLTSNFNCYINIYEKMVKMFHFFL